MADTTEDLILEIFGGSDDEDEILQENEGEVGEVEGDVAAAATGGAEEDEDGLGDEQTKAFRSLKELARDLKSEQAGRKRRKAKRSRKSGSAKTKKRRKERDARDTDGDDEAVDGETGGRPTRRVTIDDGDSSSSEGGYFGGEDVINTRKSHSDEEAEVVTNPIDIAMQTIKARKAGKGGIDGMDIARNFVFRMKEAVENDRAANRRQEPAISMLKMLPEVSDMLRKDDISRDLIEEGLLKRIAEWLWILPDQSLAPAAVRTTLLKHLDELDLDPGDLEEDTGGDIGKAIRFVKECKDELISNRNLAKRIMSKWMRMIFNLSTDHRKAAEDIDIEHVEVSVKIPKGSGLNVARANPGSSSTSTSNPTSRATALSRIKHSKGYANANSSRQHIASIETAKAKAKIGLPRHLSKAEAAREGAIIHAEIPKPVVVSNLKRRPKGVAIIEDAQSKVNEAHRISSFHKRHQKFLRDPKRVTQAAKVKIGMGLT